MIVFVIAHDHDHVRESLTCPLEELLDHQALLTFLQGIAAVGSTNVTHYADVATQD